MPSPFDSFDFAVLNDPAFGEDAVREELITPLLRALGYGLTGRYRIVRSKRLSHPFVQLGTTKQKLTLVPDYVLYVDDAAAWILDAKAPNESVDSAAHRQQAYSYAMHSEIRAHIYAVCNGREIAIYHVSDPSTEPRMRFKLDALAESWQPMLRALGSLWVRDADRSYHKDFGIHLLKSGVLPTFDLVFFSVPIPHIAKVSQAEYQFTVATTVDGRTYAATFIYGGETLGVFAAIAGHPTGDRILADIARHETAMFHFQDSLISMNIVANLTDEILETEKEHFLPLRIAQISPA